MENNDFLFDEDKAVEFIRKELRKEINEKYDDDEILFVIDTIWEFYEREGLLDINASEVEEEEMNPEKLTAYVKKAVMKDHELIMDPADIEAIVKAELDYEESLEDFI